MREIQKFSFNDYSTYWGWHSYNYEKQNGIKETGLHINDDGKIFVEYINVRE